jgi:hypothetical protein
MDYENKTYIVKVNFFDRNSYNKDETVELLCDTNNNIIGLDNYFLLTIKSAMLMIVIFLFILIVMFVCIMFSSADKFDVVEDSIQDD